MRSPKWYSPILCSIFCFCLSFSAHALDTLRPGDSIRENETLVSAGGVFELGFFISSGSCCKVYLGIWMKNNKYKKAIWIVNRDNPLRDSSGGLKVRDDGNMVITDASPNPIIVNSGAVAKSNKTRAQILDTGNLILLEDEEVIWQSFEYPTDTFLPGMKLGFFKMDKDDDRKQFLRSWLSPSVPASGSFDLGLDRVHRTQFKLWRRDGAQLQIGFWDGQRFIFLFGSTEDRYNFSFVKNEKETYLTYDNKGNGLTSWFELTSNGQINEFRMNGSDIFILNHTLCDETAPHNSDGCLETTSPMLCMEGDKFFETRGLMPQSKVVIWSECMGPIDCELMCRINCSCAAYASLHDDGTGCQLYNGVKSDILFLLGIVNKTIYLRGNFPISDQNTQKKLLLVVVLPVVSAVLSLLILLLCLLKWRKGGCFGFNRRQHRISDMRRLLPFQLCNNGEASSSSVTEIGRNKDQELPLLSFSCLTVATDNFSDANKLGEGGFGPVYKGNLWGLEVAVKRLSRSSGQGLEEFKTEVQVISKLQHRNLVKLAGYCIQEEEKILVYEYMPNRSLDSFIFDPINRTRLDCRQRLRIIEGIAQGLLYLHKYSRLRIIHRDLKISNILLDINLNPKISDFGMARIFFENETQAQTKRVVGTYGYMSPEYVMHGLFSTKSDVFSFGVIVLEIISGKKNTTFCESNYSLNLLGYAWELWKAGRCRELMDPTIAESSCPEIIFMQCIQVGLLCIQESAEDRPTMSHVVSMLSSEGAILPTPKQPAFSTHLNFMELNLCTTWDTPSPNLITFSTMEAR